MTRITSWNSQTQDNSWIKGKQEHIESHPAWRGEMDAVQAETSLKGKAPFTYLLRSGGKEHAYFITFVDENRKVKHQDFILALDLKGWHYKNVVEREPTETVDELIFQMMHCSLDECKVLDN